MKAKEAPEKIYIDDPTGEFDDHWSIYQNNDSIEYTRTDVLIKKTEEYMYKQLNEGHIECANIGTFLENYKKFMKGE